MREPAMNEWKRPGRREQQVDVRKNRTNDTRNRGGLSHDRDDGVTDHRVSQHGEQHVQTMVETGSMNRHSHCSVRGRMKPRQTSFECRRLDRGDLPVTIDL